MKDDIERLKEAKVAFYRVGGNASKNATSVRISLPKKWISAMGITSEDRGVILSFNKERICMQKQVCQDQEKEEIKEMKIIFSKVGGNASKNATSARLSLPKKWISAMGITPEDRGVTLSFDGERIYVSHK